MSERDAISPIRRLLRFYRVQTGIMMPRQEGKYIDEGSAMNVAFNEVKGNWGIGLARREKRKNQSNAV